MTLTMNMFCVSWTQFHRSWPSCRKSNTTGDISAARTH